jgi:hypothetical protein
MPVYKERKAAAFILLIALTFCSAFVAVAQTSTSVVVNFSAGAGGTIKATVDGYEIASGRPVDSGKIIVFMAFPDPECTIADWRYNGRATNATNDRFIVQIDGETSVIDVTVSFKRKPPTSAVVVFRADVAGTGTLTATVDGVPISPGDLVSVGKKVVFNAVPAAGYGIARWTVNNGTVSVDTTKYIHSVDISSAIALTGLSVIVSFEKRLPPSSVVKFRVEEGVGALTATVDGVRIASGDTVSVGKTVVFTAFPDAGYDIALWRINGAEIVDTSKYTHIFEISSTASVDVTVLFEVYDDPPDTSDAPLKGHLTFGPNPVRSGDVVTIFWDGEKEIGGDLLIFNAVGNMIDKVNVKENIGAWNTRGVATGTYLIRGMLRDKDGFTCRVLMLVGVVR